MREIEARPVILLITFRSIRFPSHGGERASGRGWGPYGEGTLTNNSLIKGAGGRVKRASVPISGDYIVCPQI